MSSGSWCKVASNLDSHPKVRRAGRNGREIFLFALRRNAEPNNPVPGMLPGSILEPWYLADQLMMSEEDARDGVLRAEIAGLLVRDGDAWRIDGWGEEWGKGPVRGADRTRKWRESKQPQHDHCDDVTSGDSRDVTNVTDRHGDACDALDQRRSEEKRVEENIVAAPAASDPPAPVQPPAKPKKSKAPPPEGYAEAVGHFDARYREAYGEKPNWNGEVGKLMSALVRNHGLPAVVSKIDFMFSGRGPRWIEPPYTVRTLSSQWSAFVAQLDIDPVKRIAMGLDS